MGRVIDIDLTNAHDEAERWFVRLLAHDCPETERRAFERWRGARPEHAAAYRNVEHLWQASAHAAKHPAVMEAARRALEETESRPANARRWLWPAAAVAASIALVAILLPAWWPSETTPEVRYQTAAGERQVLELADGSRVTLDTATTLIERYGEHARRMELEQGRAHFQVRSDAGRPFVVHAQGGTVTVLGTEFQLRVNDADTTVTLLEGRLAVAAEHAAGTSRPATTLNAGEQLAFTRDGQLGPVQPADLRTARGWTEGKLYVDDWPLRDLVDEMNRYTRVKLKLGDAQLEDIRISGVFNTDDQDTLLQILQQGWPIRAMRIASDEIMLYRRPEQ